MILPLVCVKLPVTSKLVGNVIFAVDVTDPNVNTLPMLDSGSVPDTVRASDAVTLALAKLTLYPLLVIPPI